MNKFTLLVKYLEERETALKQKLADVVARYDEAFEAGLYDCLEDLGRWAEVLQHRLKEVSAIVEQAHVFDLYTDVDNPAEDGSDSFSFDEAEEEINFNLFDEEV